MKKHLKDLFVSTPPGIEPLLADELKQLGAENVHPRGAGVFCRGDLQTAYRICLWSRFANRVLLNIATLRAADADQLYTAIRTLDWSEHMRADNSLAVSFNQYQSGIGHTRYGMQRVKDAIVDQFRDAQGMRPSIDREQPDLRIDVFLHRKVATVSIDLAGNSLHRRGYRCQATVAPLKENLAAALLVNAGWPERLQAGESFYDPMCGSGTLCIEAALMATQRAPGLQRQYWGFTAWKKHRADLWQQLRDEATAAVRTPELLITGSDRDPQAIAAATENILAAGLQDVISVSQQSLGDIQPPAARGLMVTNPPYGVRLDDRRRLPALYQELGDVMRQRFAGWRLALITDQPGLGSHLGLRRARSRAFRNGDIDCELLQYAIPLRTVARPPINAKQQQTRQMLANRLRKNLRHWQRWAARNDIQCYRVYDRDLPEYAFAIDVYQVPETHLHVQEYAPPKQVDAARAAVRREDIQAVLPEVFSLGPAQLHYKLRDRQRGSSQYRRRDHQETRFVVSEHGHRFYVNFDDYLDTGLFPDHRRARALIGEKAGGKRFLNLFAYTGSASVYAAAAGAASIDTVDMSATYIRWAEQNFALNGLPVDARYRFHQADCIDWLDAQQGRDDYDLVFLDPPTFSNSARMAGTLDIQRDHVGLIQSALRLLAVGGELIFSTNRRKFQLDTNALQAYTVTELTARTLSDDFKRSGPPHRCWSISHAG